MRSRPEGLLDYEPMFDSKQTLTGRLTDAVDLLIDFATLGEYGLEPTAPPPASCESRRRSRSLPPVAARRGTGRSLTAQR